MSRATHGGKGDGRRPESKGGAFASGYGGIDWSATREPRAELAPNCGTCDTPIKPDPLTGTTCACVDGGRHA